MLVAEKKKRPSLASRLKQIRKDRDITQQELAHAAGLSLSVLSKLEQDTKGKTDPRMSTLVQLADALGMTVSELIEE